MKQKNVCWGREETNRAMYKWWVQSPINYIQATEEIKSKLLPKFKV